MNKKLIEALTLLLKYQNKDRVIKFPVTCNKSELIVKIDDINSVSHEDMMKLRDLHFFPGCDDDFDESLDFINDDNISEDVWCNNRSSFSNCFHSFWFA